MNEAIYYLGKICLRGHEYKKTNEGLRYKCAGNCVECKKQYGKNLSREQRNSVDLYNKEYRSQNRDKIREYDRKYRRDHIEVFRFREAKYAAENKEASSCRAKDWKNKNREEYKKYQRDYRKNQFRLKTSYAVGCNLRSLVRAAFNRYSKTGKIMSSKKYGIDYEAIIKHLGPHPNSLGIEGEFHIDHIIPLSSFDLNDPEQIKIVFAPENHQWLTVRENLIKSNKL